SDRVVDDVTDAVVALLGGVLGDRQVRVLAARRRDFVARLGRRGGAVIHARLVQVAAGIDVGLDDGVTGGTGDRPARGQVGHRDRRGAVEAGRIRARGGVGAQRPVA